MFDCQWTLNVCKIMFFKTWFCTFYAPNLLKLFKNYFPVKIPQRHSLKLNSFKYKDSNIHFTAQASLPKQFHIPPNSFQKQKGFHRKKKIYPNQYTKWTLCINQTQVLCFNTNFWKSALRLINRKHKYPTKSGISR